MKVLEGKYDNRVDSRESITDRKWKEIEAAAKRSEAVETPFRLIGGGS